VVTLLTFPVVLFFLAIHSIRQNGCDTKRNEKKRRKITKLCNASNIVAQPSCAALEHFADMTRVQIAAINLVNIPIFSGPLRVSRSIFVILICLF
jgi:hypothetical protein